MRPLKLIIFRKFSNITLKDLNIIIRGILTKCKMS